jgi:hypothetical protein
MPCAVWQVEQLKPTLMWLLCCVQLVFFHNLIGEVVAFAAQRVGAVHAQIGIGKEVGDELAGQSRPG